MNNLRLLSFGLLILLNPSRLLSQKSVLKVSIDDKIECLYAVACLNNYFLVARDENNYKQKLRSNQFLDLREHKAVKMFDYLSKNEGFVGYKLIDWALQYDQMPEMNRTRIVAQPYKILKNEDDSLLDSFRIELVSFYNDPLYQKYKEEVKQFNEKLLEAVMSSKTLSELPQYLEEYYGKKLSSYHLILSPFLHSGGFNAEMSNGSTDKEVYAVIGPDGVDNGLPLFDKEYIETDMILHEFGHSFVNPITDHFADNIESLKNKFYTSEMQALGDNEGYPEWQYMFNEILLRATTIRIATLYFGEDVGMQNLQVEKDAGFDMVEPVAEILKEYEMNRSIYRSFDLFVPILISRLSEY